MAENRCLLKSALQPERVNQILSFHVQEWLSTLPANPSGSQGLFPLAAYTLAGFSSFLLRFRFIFRFAKYSEWQLSLAPLRLTGSLRLSCSSCLYFDWLFLLSFGEFYRTFSPFFCKVAVHPVNLLLNLHSRCLLSF